MARPGSWLPNKREGKQRIAARMSTRSVRRCTSCLPEHRPFAGTEPTAQIAMAAAGDAPDLAKLPEEVPVELVAVIAKALAADRDARYADAGELAADLRRFVNGQLVAAHDYTAWQRVSRWVRKHRLVTAIAALAIMVIAVGAAWSVDRIMRERDHARTARMLAETRSDQLVVDRARSLIETDPTSAVAALRALPTGSPQWPVAREIVRAAMSGGIERQLGHLPRRVAAIAFSPAGRLAASSLGGPGGTVAIFDPPRATTTIAVSASGLVWLDEHTVVAWLLENGMPAQLQLVDVETGTTRNIVAGAFDTVVVDRGAALVHRLDGSVISIGTDGAVTVRVTSGIDAIDARGGRVVFANRQRITTIDRDGVQHDLAVTIPTRIFQVRLSPTGAQVAVFAYGAVHEWPWEGGASRSWTLATDAENQVLYVGDHLYSWSSDGTGVVELVGDRGITRWLAQPAGTFGLVPATTPGATLFATKDGRIAYGTELGIVELPHRPQALARIAYDPDHRRLALGTDGGDVQVVELATALPELRVLEPASRLYAISPDRIVIGHERATELGGGLDHLEIVELATNQHHAFPPIAGFAAVEILPTAIVAYGGQPDASVVVAKLDGELRYRNDHVGAATLHAHVAFTTRSGELVQLDDALQPHVLGHLDAAVWYRLAETAAGLVVTAAGKGAPMRFDATGMHEHPFPALHEPASSFAVSADGTWWVVENYASLWRIPVLGAATRVELPQDAVRDIRILGDRIYASGHSAITELGFDGHVIRTISSVGLMSYIDRGYLLATGLGARGRHAARERPADAAPAGQARACAGHRRWASGRCVDGSTGWSRGRRDLARSGARRSDRARQLHRARDERSVRRGLGRVAVGCSVSAGQTSRTRATCGRRSSTASMRRSSRRRSRTNGRGGDDRACSGADEGAARSGNRDDECRVRGRSGQHVERDAHRVSRRCDAHRVGRRSAVRADVRCRRQRICDQVVRRLTSTLRPSGT